MEVSDDQYRSTLRQYAQILWRRRWVVLGVTVVSLGMSLTYSTLSTKVYEGTANLLLTPQLSPTLLQANNSINTPTVDVPTDTQIIESSSVAQLVARSIPDPPVVSVTEVGITSVVHVSAKSTSPKVAAAAANAYANAYIHLQQLEAVNALTNAAQLIQNHINSVQSAIDTVQNQIANGSAKSNSALTAHLTALENEQSALQTELTNYQFASTEDSGGGQIVTKATVPTKPVSPKPIEYAVLAGVLGLVLGVALARILELFDDGIRTKEDIEKMANHLPVLGLIPRIVDWRDSHAQYLVSRSSPGSIPAESYRSLRTSIQFIGLDHDVKTVQFTSPSAAEGKTTTLANLAVVMAQSGQRVVTVCCDLRRPRLHEFFGMSNQIGFTSVLLGESTLEEALQPVPGLEGLHILASGRIPPNPSELLSGSRAAEVLATLAEHADVVLIDSPPVLPVTDAAVLASRVDAVVMVVAAGISNRNQVGRALEVLGTVDAPLAGIVLNLAAESDSYYYYQYAYGGAVRPAKPSRNGKAQKARHEAVAE